MTDRIRELEEAAAARERAFTAATAFQYRKSDERIRELETDLTTLRLELAAHAAILGVTRGERDRLRVAARALVATWDAPIVGEDGLDVAIEVLRGALAGRGEG